MMNLLKFSYSPDVRYGVALAIGLSCAGTGLKEAIEILESMLKDNERFVR